MPFLDSVVLPALVAFGATGLIRRLGGRKSGERLAEAGLGLGFLAGFAALMGGLPFVARVAHHQEGEVAAVTLCAGAVLAALDAGPRLTASAALLAGLYAVAWPLGYLRGGGHPAEDLAWALVAGLMAAAVMLRLAALARSGAAAVLVLAVAAAGLGWVAGMARAGAAAGLAAALAAAAAGMLVWAMPLAKRRSGPLAVLVGGGTFAALALAVARAAPGSSLPVLVLIAAFWGDRIAQRLPLLGKLERKPASRPLAAAAGAALPALAAAALASLIAR
jgi:hypothetical protein